MHGNFSQKFSLQIKNGQGHLTFFSLPKSNKYQQITNLVFSKSSFRNTADQFYKNTILILESTDTQTINFEAILKEQSIKISHKKPIFLPKAKEYIRNNKYINSNDLQIKSIAKKIKGKTTAEILRNSYDFVLSYLEYGYPYEGLYSYSQALRYRVTDCGGFSTLLCSILNAKGIPTRLVSGFLLKEDRSTKILYLLNFPLSFNNLSMHAWVEALMPDGSWFVMDPSIEWRRNKKLTNRVGGFGFVPNDRLVVSFGQDFKVNFNNKQYEIPLLQNPIALKI